MSFVEFGKRATTVGTDTQGCEAPRSRSHSYSDTFYRYIGVGSSRSAKVVVPLVLQQLSPVSVLDVGCGTGAWLSEYRDCNVTDYFGVDGAYLQPASLVISANHFRSMDVAREFDLGRRFDLVQCLEVGEHMSKASSDTLIGNLTRHGDKVLFSAATPGQGGENHINEQTPEFWRQLFDKYGYKPFDSFRPMIKGLDAVEVWYRRNIILYVAETVIPALPPIVLRSGIRDDQMIPEMASWAYRIQARVLSFLPAWCLSKAALLKHRIIISYRFLSKS